MCVGRPPIPASGNPVATLAPQHWIERRRRRTRKEQRSRTPSAVQLCSAIGCLVRPQSRLPGCRVPPCSWSPQQLVPTTPPTPHLPSASTAPSKSWCTLSPRRKPLARLASTLAPQLPDAVFHNFEAWGAVADPLSGDPPADLSLGWPRASHWYQKQGWALCVSRTKRASRGVRGGGGGSGGGKKEDRVGMLYSQFLTPPLLHTLESDTETHHKCTHVPLQSPAGMRGLQRYRRRTQILVEYVEKGEMGKLGVILKGHQELGPHLPGLPLVQGHPETASPSRPEPKQTSSSQGLQSLDVGGAREVEVGGRTPLVPGW